MKTCRLKVGIIMDEETFTEAIEWALETFPQLQKVGESSEYLGGFKFSNPSMRYRRMSYEVASFGKRVGVDLLRPKSKALTQVLHPLPVGINLAVSNTLSYKNSKHLPSVAVADTQKRVRNFTTFANQHPSDKFLFLTLPASLQRMKASELDEEIDLCFQREREFEQELFGKYGEAVQIAGLRLELPYDTESRTFHPHFHAIATWDEDLNIQDFETWLREFIVSAGFHSVSCEASLVDSENIEKVTSYIFKPCLSAYKIAKAGHSEEFRLYVGELKKRVARTRGAYAQFEKERKVAAKAERNDRRRRNSATDAEDDGLSERGERGREPCVEDLPHGVPNEPQNVLCGVSDCVALPSGRKSVWSTVKNFTPSSDGMPNRFGGVSTVDLVNAAAMKRWEANTGREYSLKEFIRPFAQELTELLEGGRVQYCTITCSSEIIDILHEIKREESPAKRSIGKRAVKRGFWSKFRQALKRVWPCSNSLVRRLQKWLAQSANDQQEAQENQDSLSNQ